jgi:copper(I)-binding protein
MRSLVAVMVAAVALAGCEQAQLGVEDAWVRLPAVSSRPGAAYFTVKGGNEATSLLAVSSPAAVRTELHEMKHEGGMMTMAPIKDVAIPAGATVKFEPGGKHIMLYDLSPELRAPGQEK